MLWLAIVFICLWFCSVSIIIRDYHNAVNGERQGFDKALEAYNEVL